jgi:hypothetical protein
MSYQGMSHLNLLTQLKSRQMSNTAFVVFFDTEPDDLDDALLTALKPYPALILYVDDINQKIPGMIMPNTHVAAKIAKYLAVNAQQNIVISCTAGISRTGAVIHYLDVLHHNENSWRRKFDSQFNLYYYVNSKFVANPTLDNLLQKKGEKLK